MVAGTLVGFMAIAFAYLARQATAPTPPDQISQQFFLDNYTGDYPAVWQMVSTQDQTARSEEQFLADKQSPNQAQAALYQQLASWGTFQVVALVSNQTDQVIVTAQTHFPDRSQPEFQRLIGLAAADGADQEQLLSELQQLYQQDRLRYIEDQVGYNLVSQDGDWRVVQHWGELITVQLSGTVSPGLPWEFYPLQRQVEAVPGELVRVDYLARNNSDHEITAQAVHKVGPPEVASYFETLECFCFTETTLAAGEQRQLTLQFRIDPSLPAGAAYFQDRYTFYSMGEFPSDG